MHLYGIVAPPDGDGEVLEQTQEPPAKGSGKEGKGKRAKKTTTEQAQSEEVCIIHAGE